jgi:phthalate 4,5-dioxygenase
MLSREENELLTRTGPGTPMGALFRSFWLPCLMATELPGPDCPPVRVRLLGEDLVAFRDTEGRLGLLQALCAHRGAPLFFGRNEQCGLRCVYHGWKYDISGRCVDMPNEPPESNFKDKVRLVSYPLQEAGGALWAYLGPPDQQPELPQLEWARVAPEQRYLQKRVEHYNYLQSLEGELDSSHVSFLHRRDDGFFQSGLYQGYGARHPVFADPTPRFTILETDYGLLVGARRTFDAEYYWRLTQYLLPTYTLIGPPPGRYSAGNVVVPIDDESHLNFAVAYHNDRAFTDEEIAQIETWEHGFVELDPKTFRPLRNKENDYLIDREWQRTRSFSGIRGIQEQDTAVQEGAGLIVDRTVEHLGSSDAAVIQMRRLLLRLVADLQRGTVPYAAQHGDVYHVRAAQVRVDPALQVPIHEHAREQLRALV